MAMTAAPAFYTAVPLDFREAHNDASASFRAFKLPIQVKQERDAARVALAMQPPPRPYTPFFVPDRILEKPQEQTDSEEQAALLKLPAELLLLIVENIRVPYFQVTFGLSCKTIASLLSNNRERLAPWRGFRDKEGLYRLLARQPRLLPPRPPPLIRRRKPDLNENLANVTLDAESELSNTFIPTDLKICRACFRHVPRARSHPRWLRYMGSDVYNLPHVNCFDIMNFFNESSRNCGQHKCPECCLRNYTCFMSEKEYERALAEDYVDEEVNFIELGEGGRRVCLELPGRLARP